MTCADIIVTLRSRAPDIRALGATSLYLFGSAARGEARDDSDMDLFIDYDPDRFSFVELIRRRDRLSHILGACRPYDARGPSSAAAAGDRSRGDQGVLG